MLIEGNNSDGAYLCRLCMHIFRFRVYFSAIILWLDVRAQWDESRGFRVDELVGETSVVESAL